MVKFTIGAVSGTMTLGDIIAKLKRCAPEDYLTFDFGYFAPCGIGSWRGDYADLALRYEATSTTVGDVLPKLEAAIGKDFSGWKGGQYRGAQDTPVMVGNPDEAHETRIVKIVRHDNTISIVTTTHEVEWSEDV